MAGRVFLDLTPLRQSRALRLLWAGEAVSTLGSSLTRVAMAFQVFELTRSSLSVGLLGLATLVPLLLTSLIGGALADRHDRRLVAAGASVVASGVPIVLAVNAALDHPSLAAIYVAAALAGFVQGLGQPSLDSLIPRLVRPDQMTATSALLATYGTGAMILGPLLAGVLLAGAGLAPTYLVDAASWGVTAACLFAIGPVAAPCAGDARHVPQVTDEQKPTLRSIVEGIAYLRGRPVLQGTYLVDFVAMFFGMPLALFPALALGRFHGDAHTLGYLYAAPAVGAAIVTVASGWASRVERHGLAITIAALVWGSAIIAFGVLHTLGPALLFLAVAGGADMVSGLFRMTIWGQVVDDEVRGRLAGLTLLNVNGGPLMGDLEAGAVASWRGPGFSVVSGGIACVIGTLACALALPAFVRYRAGAPDPAQSPAPS